MLDLTVVANCGSGETADQEDGIEATQMVLSPPWIVIIREGLGDTRSVYILVGAVLVRLLSNFDL